MTSAQQAERLKFLANFFGNAAIVVFGAGILAPLADSANGSQPTGAESWATAMLMLLSLFASAVLCVRAQKALDKALQLDTMVGD